MIYFRIFVVDVLLFGRFFGCKDRLFGQEAIFQGQMKGKVKDAEQLQSQQLGVADQ